MTVGCMMVWLISIASTLRPDSVENVSRYHSATASISAFCRSFCASSTMSDSKPPMPLTMSLISRLCTHFSNNHLILHCGLAHFLCFVLRADEVGIKACALAKPCR